MSDTTVNPLTVELSEIKVEVKIAKAKAKLTTPPSSLSRPVTPPLFSSGGYRCSEYRSIYDEKGYQSIYSDTGYTSVYD